ncbi:cytochrome c nitrite reductase small subunit [Natronoflexus pectinivorans]|uniref:Cytochrome c nitrite reductase small subunit n=1 Tax=Natronoflexus pectinivorans TaxID=682526 RepID=A0A4R2GFK2_9BACT|nr:cytochrome c nitrite reductase small subunit [Natronoflexus pectinivorans]TCO06985.1 cytochrome c nitrite reductase small subunit [Natronoflexus pectinivorans]
MRIPFLKWLVPPDQWKFPVIILLGIFAGLGFFVIHMAKVPSYLADTPETCVNCHIMAPQYATWSHSSHREVATCSDCHMPHDNLFNHYLFKAKAGMNHAYVFTFRLEPQVITIHQEGKDVVQNNCIRCHSQQIHDTKLYTMRPDFHPNIGDRYCIECHRDVPHGTVNSISSVPDARVPVPTSPVPEWLRGLTK